MKIKRIVWSYPTSENAAKFGYSKTGCFTLQTGEHNVPLEAIAGHSEQCQLITMGNRLTDFTWSKYQYGGGIDYEVMKDTKCGVAISDTPGGAT